MTLIPKFVWIESSPFSKLLDGGVWHSGRVIDLFYLSGDSLLVGTETGGLWRVDGDVAHPMSDDWDHPNITCIVQRRGFPPYSMLCGTEGGFVSQCAVDR
jgi:hypothetical protein